MGVSRNLVTISLRTFRMTGRLREVSLSNLMIGQSCFWTFIPYLHKCITETLHIQSSSPTIVFNQRSTWLSEISHGRFNPSALATRKKCGTLSTSILFFIRMKTALWWIYENGEGSAVRDSLDVCRLEVENKLLQSCLWGEKKITSETANSFCHMITRPLNAMIFNSLYFAVIRVENNPWKWSDYLSQLFGKRELETKVFRFSENLQHFRINIATSRKFAQSKVSRTL